MPASPSPLNYFQGSGNLYWTPTGGAERHLGNAIKFTLKPTFTKTEHNERMSAARAVDKTFITGRKLEVAATLEEITPENMELQFLGTLSVNTAGNQQVSVFTVNSKNGQFRLAGSNDDGSRYEVVVPTVELQPEGEFDFLGEGFGELQLTGTATNTSGLFATIEEIAEEATA
jgi:hypothetical protein